MRIIVEPETGERLTFRSWGAYSDWHTTAGIHHTVRIICVIEGGAR